MQKENLSQRTAETLQKMILKEHIYKYGEKLPNENELSAKLGISRTTLREAIRILASDGLLEVRRGTAAQSICRGKHRLSGVFKAQNNAERPV